MLAPCGKERAVLPPLSLKCHCGKPSDAKCTYRSWCGHCLGDALTRNTGHRNHLFEEYLKCPCLKCKMCTCVSICGAGDCEACSTAMLFDHNYDDVNCLKNSNGKLVFGAGLKAQRAQESYKLTLGGYDHEKCPRCEWPNAFFKHVLTTSCSHKACGYRFCSLCLKGVTPGEPRSCCHESATPHVPVKSSYQGLGYRHHPGPKGIPRLKKVKRADQCQWMVADEVTACLAKWA